MFSSCSKSKKWAVVFIDEKDARSLTVMQRKNSNRQAQRDKKAKPTDTERKLEAMMELMAHFMLVMSEASENEQLKAIAKAARQDGNGGCGQK